MNARNSWLRRGALQLDAAMPGSGSAITHEIIGRFAPHDSSADADVVSEPQRPYELSTLTDASRR